ncbi:LOW QUALITY PROTEIN: aquaporin-10-like [Phoenicopterus ruber ruber]
MGRILLGAGTRAGVLPPFWGAAGTPGGADRVRVRCRHCCRCCPFLADTVGAASFGKSAQALLRIRNPLARERLAEPLAVFGFTLVTLSSSARTVTGSETKGNVFAAYLAGALAVTVAVYTAGGVSGAHPNPASSLAMSLEQFPWWKLPIFPALQIFGAFVSSGAVCAPCYDAIWHYGNGTLTASGPRETASIFATYRGAEPVPAPQVTGTALPIVGTLAITDTHNKGVPKGLEPVVVALLVFALETSVGSNRGCAINPARDFGPRLFTCVAGWGAEVLRWVEGDPLPTVPRPQQGQWGVVGAVGGADAGGLALYRLFVAFHHPAAGGDPPTQQSPLVLVNAALRPDAELAPGEKDAGGTRPQKM